MADVNRGNRPLSPHLSIYRMQINMLTSIMNRITGAGMIVSAIMIVWWLLAAATSAEYFDFVSGIMTSWLGLIILIGSLWALWFHFLSGLRHLYMDFGKGYSIAFANVSGWIILVGSVLLTALTVSCAV